MLDVAHIQEAHTGKIGFFRFKRFDDQTYLITNDAGKFVFLSSADFATFISGDLETLSSFSELKTKGFIQDKDYQEKMTGSVALKNHFVGLGPSLHMMVLTLRCNHHCRYCHAAVAPMTATEMDMTRETATKVVDTIFYSNAQDITIEFQGGEALINYDVLQYVVEYATSRAQHLQKKLSLSLVSNLTLMTEEKLSWLLDHGVDICTSLDGDKLTHNGNRTGYDGDSFDTVTYWLQRVSEEKQKRGMGKIGALLTATKSTLPKYKEIIDTYMQLGLDSIFLRWLNPYGFAAADLENLAYADDDWIEFYKKSLDYIIDINKNGRFFKESITCVYLIKILSPVDPGFMDIRSPSGLAVGGVAYNYDGKIYASDESRMLGRMGDESFLMSEAAGTAEENYREMIDSDTAKIAIQATTLDGLPGYNEHVYKPYLGVDIIHNHKTAGNIYHPIAKDGKMQLQIQILDYIFEKLRDPEVAQIFHRWIDQNR